MIVASNTRLGAPVEIDHTYSETLLKHSHIHISAYTDGACDVNDIQGPDSSNQYCAMKKFNHPTAIMVQTGQEFGSDNVSAPSIVHESAMADSTNVSLNSTSDAMTAWEEAICFNDQIMNPSSEPLYSEPDLMSASICDSFIEQGLQGNQNGLDLVAHWDNANVKRHSASLSSELLGVPSDEFDTTNCIFRPHEMCPTSLSADARFCESLFPQHDPNVWNSHAGGIDQAPISPNIKIDQSEDTFGIPFSAYNALSASHVEEPVRGRRRKSSRRQRRDDPKDMLLVNCRAMGMSYRAIKKYGEFEEAESTLRGRYRALTKPRDERPRKPQWTARDVCLYQSSGLSIAKGI